MGRRRVSEDETIGVGVRLPAAVKHELDRQATEAGETFSAHARGVLTAHAKKTWPWVDTEPALSTDGTTTLKPDPSREELQAPVHVCEYLPYGPCRHCGKRRI